MRMRKKPNLGQRMERCAQFLQEEPERLRGQWCNLKPEAKQVWLELGCGKGKFTAEMAEQNPDVLYLAVERGTRCNGGGDGALCGQGTYKCVLCGWRCSQPSQLFCTWRGGSSIH